MEAGFSSHYFAMHPPLLFLYRGWNLDAMKAEVAKSESRRFA